MFNDSVTAFERLAQISADAPYYNCVRAKGLNKKLYEFALKADAKRMAASLKKEITQVGLAVA